MFPDYDAMKVALHHNHRAGAGEIPRRKLVSMLRRHGYEPHTLTREQIKRGRQADVPGEFVIVAGGDGSVKHLAFALAGTGRPLAILPTGTANNIAHSLGIRGAPEDIIAGWSKATRGAIDLGVARGPWGRRYFIESIGVGLIGRAIALLERIGDLTAREPTEPDDRLHRDLCVLLALTDAFRPVPLRLRLDARREKRGRFLLCEILNIRRTGPGIELSKSVDAADGFLDLVSVEAGERAKLRGLLERCLAGKVAAPLLRTRRTRRVRLRLGAHELRADDEVIWPPRIRRGSAGAGRRVSVTIEIVSGALACLLPRRSAR